MHFLCDGRLYGAFVHVLPMQVDKGGATIFKVGVRSRKIFFDPPLLAYLGGT